MRQQSYLPQKSLISKLVQPLILVLAVVMGGNLVSAQETNRHPLFGTTGFDHYPHFNKSYHYGDLEFRKKQQQASMQKYGKNKGRVLGTLLGAVAGGLIDNDPLSAKGMVLGGMTGGIIGQTIVDDPQAPIVIRHTVSGPQRQAGQVYQATDHRAEKKFIQLSETERKNILKAADHVMQKEEEKEGQQ